MTLCFGAFIRVLKLCAKPKVYNKTLCGAVVKCLDEYYGGILESDDSTVSHLLSCDNNLSPDDVIEPMKKANILTISQGMEKFVIPLLNPDLLPLAILSLQDLALSTVSSDNAKIGRLNRADLVVKVSFSPADFFADIFYFVTTGIENKSGKETINKVTKAFVNSFEKSKGTISEKEKKYVRDCLKEGKTKLEKMKGQTNEAFGVNYVISTEQTPISNCGKARLISPLSTSQSSSD